MDNQTRKCPWHHIIHDRHIDCPECALNKPKAQPKPKQDIFKDVIWPIRDIKEK